MLNGRTDTLTSGVNSNNNSLLLSQKESANSGSNSPSRFAGGGGGRKDSGRVSTFGNTLLKAAIVKNAERNNANFEEESPKKYLNSGFSSRANEVQNYEEQEVSNENTQVEKIHETRPDRHPSKLVMPSKRFSLIDGKGTTSKDTSPTISPQKISPQKNSATIKVFKYGEETKTQ